MAKTAKYGRCMTNPNDKFSENVPGAWYVTTDCIDCGLCDDALPSVFKRSDAAGQNYVHRQPETAKEFADAEEARELCPAEAIGSEA